MRSRPTRSLFPLFLALMLGLYTPSVFAQDADTTPESPPASPPSTQPVDAREQRALERIRRANPDAEPDINPLGELLPVDPDRLAAFDTLTNTLADPSMEGRWPGTPGIEQAATLIEDEFRRLKLQPIFPSTTTLEDGTKVTTPRDTYRQHLDRGEDLEISKGSLSVHQPQDGRPSLSPARGSTHAVVPYSGTGSVTGPLVFCGYAITAGPGDYMNFPVDADLSDKVAVILTHEPMTDEGVSLWANTGWSLHSTVTAKISAVTRRGAKAVLVVRPPALHDDTFMTKENSPQTGRFESIPVLMLSEPLAEALLSRADPEARTLDELVALANAAPTLIDLDAVTVTITTEVTRTPQTTDNLGAMLKGRGPLASEYVVVGAHYDHVGQGTIGSSTPGLIHPGADDNASGTAAMLLVAQSLTDAYDQLNDDASARSILFLAFTAEETGLEGSIQYVRRPPLPLEDHTLMLNLDMVGRMRDGLLELGGLQSAPKLEDFVNPHLAESGLRVRRGSSIGDNRSDHASFDRKKIPNLFFFTGLHDEYHTPDDTADLLNDDGGVRIADLVAAIALDAATLEPRLTHQRARRAIGAPITPRVRIGIIPAPHPDGGLSVRKVSENTSASAAGILTYDRITHWDGEPLDLQRFERLLTELTPGDTVTLTIIRDDEEIEIEMTLNAPG